MAAGSNKVNLTAAKKWRAIGFRQPSPELHEQRSPGEAIFSKAQLWQLPEHHRPGCNYQAPRVIIY